MKMHQDQKTKDEWIVDFNVQRKTIKTIGGNTDDLLYEYDFFLKV